MMPRSQISRADLKLPTTKSVEAALGELSRLPLMPYAAQQAVALAAKEDADLGEFTRLLERDITLAASILKLANSPIFGGGRYIDSIEQAVIRLGIRECRNLLTAAAMACLYQQTEPATKAYCAILWKHSFLTACFARRLSQEFKCEFRGEEFTAGLLHDLGRILLAITMPDQLLLLDPLDFIEADDLLDRERDVLGTDHCSFGVNYAQQNALPASVIAAIGFHHKHREGKEHHGILNLVVAADHLANHVQRGDAVDRYDIANNPGIATLAQTWPKERTTWFSGRLPGLIHEVVSQDIGASGSIKLGSSKPGRSPEAPDKAGSAEGVWKRISSWF